MQNKIILVLVLSLALFLRAYKIASYPPLNADEAAIGYNAYSLIKTGKDEHGNSWPIHFKSFGDYKPGGYFYLVLPFVKFLGLTELAVRLPNLILSVLTIFIVYKLAILIWKNKKLGLIWVFILAVSPWHIHFSRGGWESCTALFFIVLGTYYFYKYLFYNSKFSVLGSIFFFILSLYFYHSARIIAPLLFVTLCLFNFKVLWKTKEKLVLPIILGLLLVLPVTISFLKTGGLARFSGVGLFADQGPVWRVNELLNQHSWQEGRFPWFRLLHNKPVIYFLAFAENYFSHFDGDFLFINGDSVPRSKVPDMGVLYLLELPFIILGVITWLRSDSKHKYLPVVWLLISPLASSLTFQAPSALRSLSMVIFLTFFVAYGVNNLILVTRLKFYIMAGVACCYAYSIFSWHNNYFVHYLKRYPSAWPDFRPVAEELKNLEDNQKVCIETTHLDQPYILTLFYEKYPPGKIQQEIELTVPDKFGFSTVKSFGKYKFGLCDNFSGDIIKL